MEAARQKARLMGYMEARIVGMRYHNLTREGKRKPDPQPGDPLTLLREPDNTFDPNAVMAVDAADSCHVGYIAREQAAVLAPLLDAESAFARAIISVPCNSSSYSGAAAIPCQVMLFSFAPIPALAFCLKQPSSPDFVLYGTPLAANCTLQEYDGYIARCFRVRTQTQTQTQTQTPTPTLTQPQPQVIPFLFSAPLILQIESGHYKINMQLGSWTHF